MFAAANIQRFPYGDPWSHGFEERLAALSRGERRIAYFYEEPDSTVFRYRVFNMIQALKAAPDLHISASWFSRADQAHADLFVDRADALVICRTRYDAAIGRMIARAKARRIPVLFDVDDFIFDADYIHLIQDASDQVPESDLDWTKWFGHVGRIGATLRLCDGAITTNQLLADRISIFAPRIVPRIVPNFLNRLQQAESQKIWNAKYNSGFARDGKTCIGYFSGTPTHNRDFEIASDVLAKILDENPRVVLRVAGFIQAKGPLLRHRDRIEFHPFQDFLNLQRLIGEVEINIAPVQNNIFSNCKSELKYFEAGIVGSLTIASPTFTFRNAIRDGENGFLSNSCEWESKVRAVLDLIDKPDQYAALAASAYHHTLETYGWDCYAAQIETAVFDNSNVISKRQAASL